MSETTKKVYTGILKVLGIRCWQWRSILKLERGL